jgi:flagellar biosynthesis activator protein FlaF
MSRASYAQTLDEDPGLARQDERTALLRLTSMLDEAALKGVGSCEAVNALAMVNTVWSHLLEDLIRPENDFPVELRARLISIGIFLLKEVEAIRSGRSTDFRPLRDILETVAEGLA